MDLPEEIQLTEEMLDIAMEVAHRAKDRRRGTLPEPEREGVLEWICWHCSCPAGEFDSSDPCHLTQVSDVVEAYEVLVDAWGIVDGPNDGCPCPEYGWDIKNCWLAWLRHEAERRRRD
jgi:hypothetical protein